MKEIKVLDHGYIKFIESYGNGEARPDDMEEYGRIEFDAERGIIEAARQSTQGGFKGWGEWRATPSWLPGFGTNLPPGRQRVPASVFSEWAAQGRPEKYIVGTLVWSDIRFEPGDEKLLRYLHEHKHATPFEFAGMVIEVQAPIFVFREWQRHRTQSYNEMSARYAPMPNVHYIPTKERIEVNQTDNKQAQGVAPLNLGAAEIFRACLQSHYATEEKIYSEALASGIPKELARLPVSVARYSRMRAAANLRNWLGFLTLRMDPAAQFEIRQYANAIGEIIAEQFPQTWKLFSEGRK